MEVVSGVATDFPETIYSAIAHYRHRVFIEQLGWELRTQGGVELDQFDRPDTIYLAAQNLVAPASLLPGDARRHQEVHSSNYESTNNQPCNCHLSDYTHSRAVMLDGQSLALAIAAMVITESKREIMTMHYRCGISSVDAVSVVSGNLADGAM